MMSFKNAYECIRYILDNLHTFKLKVKIEYFDFNKNSEILLVYYRLGRKKILLNLPIAQFEKRYFEQVSNYDRFRLIKFSSYQKILKESFEKITCSKSSFINNLEAEIRDEQLF